MCSSSLIATCWHADHCDTISGDRRCPADAAGSDLIEGRSTTPAPSPCAGRWPRLTARGRSSSPRPRRGAAPSTLTRRRRRPSVVIARRSSSAASPWGAGWSEHDLVFPALTGGPADLGAWRKSLRRAVRDAGLPVIRLHDLRHTHASHMLATDVRTVAARLGHSDRGMTLRGLRPRDARPTGGCSERCGSAGRRGAAMTGDHAVTTELVEAVPRPGAPLLSRAFGVRPLGFEPRTCGLRVRCSAVELEAPAPVSLVGATGHVARVTEGIRTPDIRDHNAAL